MRILHISSARALGGGERHLADLARGLAERGHEVFAALAPGSPLEDTLGAILPSPNIFTLPLRHSLDLPSARALARLAHEKGADVLHAHVARDYPLAAFAARRAHRTRLVITRHVLFPLGRAHRLTLADVSRVIAVSEAVARSLGAQKIFAPHKIRVVPNAIDTAKFERAARDTDRAAARHQLGARARFLVGTVGELSVVKGQDEFIRAAAIISGRLQGSAEFVVVGEDGSRGGRVRRTLERLVGELGLGGRVHLLGRRGDVAQLLPALDVFVSASRSEAFGLAMVEAMASGLPVVATETEGAREILRHGETGRLVPVGDHRALAEAVVELLRDEHLRAELGARAQAAVRERFDIGRMISETEGVYLEALKEAV